METPVNFDSQAIQRAIIARLPLKARWEIGGVPADYNFSAAQRGLRTPSAEDFCYDPGDEWLDLMIFGDVDYSEGGGAHPYLCVRIGDGMVVCLDVERLDAKGRGEAVSTLNSSIEAFIETWSYLNMYLGQGMPLPPDADLRLQLIDPEEYPQSDWRMLVNFLTEA
jgi:hypothetical protein